MATDFINTGKVHFHHLIFQTKRGKHSFLLQAGLIDSKQCSLYLQGNEIGCWRSFILISLKNIHKQGLGFNLGFVER